MIASRLVRMIETHAEQLAGTLIENVHNNEKLAEYRRVTEPELKQRVFEVYHNLSEWLLTKTEGDIERRYRAIGARRAAQGMQLSTLIWGITTTKATLWDFIRREGMVERQVELFQELELLQMVDQFFERAIYYAACGYEHARATRAATAA